jgi:hypothetical protein
MIKGRKIKDGSFAAVIRGFLISPNFTRNAKSTRDGWYRELMLVEEHLGSKSKLEIEPSMIQEFLDGIADWPGKQLMALCALKQLDRWAVVRKHLRFPCTYGCEAIGCDEGHIPWTDEQVTLGEKFARGGFSRVITLAVNTGQRLSDFTRMCWTDMEIVDGRNGINVRGGQKKTKRSQWVPLTPELAEAMETWERRPGPIVRRPDGSVWKPGSISKQWGRERDSNPALEPLRDVEFEGMTRDLVLHGLRGTACVRLLRAGANTRQIADMVGMSEQTVKRYTRFSEQKKNATAAVHHMERTTIERKRLKG